MSDDKKDHLNGHDQWVPLDLGSLEILEEDEVQKTRKTSPDFSLFKALYDDPGIKKEDFFKRLYETASEADGQALSREDQFKSLHDGGKNRESSNQDFSPESGSESESESGPGHIPPTGPENEINDLEDQGMYENSQLAEHARKEAYDKAFEQGQKEGYDEGFKQGLEQGHEKGLDQGIEQGEKQGYAAGAERGEAEAKAIQDEKAKLLIASLETILLKTEGTWDELVKRYEGKMISLISRIAEKVVQARVKIDKGVVRQSIIHALELLPEPEEIVLQVSEEDYEYIDMIKEDFFQSIKSLTSISVVANSGIKRGGCKIESATARVETDVESRLQAVLDSVVAQGDI